MSGPPVWSTQPRRVQAPGDETARSSLNDRFYHIPSGIRVRNTAHMDDHHAKVSLDALYDEGDAMRDALLNHDLTEVRFRAREMARLALVLGLASVQRAAEQVIDQLGPEGASPRGGYGAAVFALSDALHAVDREKP